MIHQPVKVLLVDDTPENLVALEALLRRDGLELLKASSSREALELLLVHDVSLALLDVQMPEMDGFELAELMRGAERTKHVPIIFITAGNRDPQRVFKGYDSGAVDFLFKPIDPHILKSKVDVFIELARQRQQVIEALRVNEIFVGILGHDLRNPLGAMIAGAELLQRQLSDERQLKALSRMAAAGRRMATMIEQLLDLTRARLAGGLGFVRGKRTIDVRDLVQRAIDELRVAHPDRQILIEASGDCELSGDPERLLQVFSNLIGNALTHGAKGAPITATVSGRDREITIAVRNDGVIAPELVPTMFEPFRGKPQRSSASTGLGLGLFISQQIALAHGGGISVASTHEVGTVFTLHLPRTATGAIERLTAPVPHVPQPGKSVLIVEDEEHLRESLRIALEGEDYRVETAADGREALEMMQREPHPDVVILDLMLPVLDGNRVYQAMQADPVLAEIPVVVSTANPAEAPHGLIVLPKPLKLAHLLDEVARLTA